MCNADKIYKTYSGAGGDAFKGSKKRFRDFIKENYQQELYKDSGYLNFRFLVNCEGNAGWFEIIEMNLDLEEQNLDDKMVQELFQLTSKPGNWNTLSYNDKNWFDYYMHISYRIENGKITEILP